MTKHFYRAFEECLRGSRELIKERQTVYLPFIEPLKTLYTSCPTLDLGCGRGEWLEILQESGFEARGIDLDQGMLDACNALHLPAEQGEAVDTLRLLADESQALVSGFHIAEHMPFENLQQLVAEALRVLKPAGLLILESPNAENLLVGTNNFYLDPTHERPIPHLLLSFLTEHTGFARIKLLRLQEPPELAKAKRITLMDVLARVSPDYAIVAQKEAPAKQMALFDQPFDKECGLSLDTLANRYDNDLQRELQGLKETTSETETVLYRQLEQVQAQTKQLQEMADNTDVILNQFRLQLENTGSRIEKAESRDREIEAALRGSIAQTIQAEIKQAAAESANETLRQQTQQATEELIPLRAQTHQFELQLQQSRQQLNEAQQRAHHWQLQANAYETQAKNLLDSTSWRITKPLRLVITSLRRVKGWSSQITRRLLRPLLTRIIRRIMARPELKRQLLNRLRQHPILFQHLKLFALNRGLLGPVPIQASSPQGMENDPIEDLSLLTSRARRIHTQLKKTIQDKDAP